MAPDRRHAPRCRVLGRADMTRYRRSLRPCLATRVACHPPWPLPAQAPRLCGVDVLTPHRLAEALALKGERPAARAITGGTDVMVELNFDRSRPEAILD